MNFLDSRKILTFTVLATIQVISVISITSPEKAFAEIKTTPGFTVLTGDQLKNNPTAMNILEKIEQSKLILAELQAGKTIKNDHQRFVDEQRKIANEKLQEQLSRMYKKYEDYTPRAAFGSFLSGVNGTYHDIFWGQFNYMDNKVQLARAAMNEVLQNGGSYHDARQAYFKYASMTRVEMIEVNQELNIKYGFGLAEVQEAFDKYGKLPRTED